MKNEILDFINRRFSDKRGWLNGNCFWFAKILCERFSFTEICYCPVAGHFVTRDLSDGLLYDCNGIYETDENPIPLSVIQREDHLWYNRLIRDCLA